MAEINMEEQIKLLIELQGLDKEIFKIEKEIALAPHQIKELEDTFKRKEEEAKAADSELKNLQLAHKDKEAQLKAKEEAIKKLETQLYQVKTNKEYTAMDNEIKTARADCSLLEEEILILFDKMDEAGLRKKQRNENLKVGQGKTEEEKNKILNRIKELEEQLNLLKSQRKNLSEKADKTILAKYERILYGKDGLALVPVRNGACQGCFLDMPPQVINEINMKKELIFCESCARILYLEE